MTSKPSRKEIGRLGEAVAAKFLESKGFKILELNYWRPWGEIDIVAEKGDVVRFVEVKTVSRESLGDFSREKTGYRPEEQVHEFKLQKVGRTAEMYMAEKDDSRDFQIDVVGVHLNVATRKAQCSLLEQVL